MANVPVQGRLVGEDVCWVRWRRGISWENRNLTARHLDTCNRMIAWDGQVVAVSSSYSHPTVKKSYQSLIRLL